MAELVSTLLSTAVGAGLSIFGQSQANAESRRAQRKAERQQKKLHKYNIEEAERQRDFQIEQIDQAVRNQQEAARTQLDNLIQDRRYSDEINLYKHDKNVVVYDAIVDEIDQQLGRNQEAIDIAFAKQDNYIRDQQIGLEFQGRSDTISYIDKLDKLGLQERQVDEERDFKFRRNRVGQQKLDLQRRKQRAESAFKQQSLTIKGLKEAGTAQARGQTGRTAGKTIQGLMAENGAERAAVAEMTSLQGEQYLLDTKENVIQLQQLNAALSLEHAKIAQATQVLEKTRQLDIDKLQATYLSLERADNIAREDLIFKKEQADANALAQIPFMPELGPLASEAPLPEIYIPEMSYPLEIDPPPFLAPITTSQPNPWVQGITQIAKDLAPTLITNLAESNTLKWGDIVPKVSGSTAMTTDITPTSGLAMTNNASGMASGYISGNVSGVGAANVGLGRRFGSSHNSSDPIPLTVTPYSSF